MSRQFAGLTFVVVMLATFCGACDGDTQPLDDGDVGADAIADAEARNGESDVNEDAEPDASTEPDLLDISELTYVGAFRVPAGEFGASNMNFAQGPIAYDAQSHSVYLVGHTHHQALAQFSVPALVDSETVSELEMADDPIQPFSSVLDRVDNPQSINRIGGMAVLDGENGVELLVNAYEYYDAPGDNTHTSLVVRDASDLEGAAVDGYFEMGGRAHASGWMSPIPSEWQQALGGTHLTGSSSGQPIISRLSVGPTAFVFDPFEVVGTEREDGAIETSAMLDFSLQNPLREDLSNESGDNDVWTHLSRATYGFIAPNSRTYVTLGHSGGHDSGVCYKCVQTGKEQPCGGYCPNDPSDSSTYYWLWDVEDLVAVKEGRMQPHEVRPYDYGRFEIPFASKSIGGGSFDPESNRLYLTAQKADRDQGRYANPPVIMVYEVN